WRLPRFLRRHQQESPATRAIFPAGPRSDLAPAPRFLSRARAPPRTRRYRVRAEQRGGRGSQHPLCGASFRENLRETYDHLACFIRVFRARGRTIEQPLDLSDGRTYLGPQAVPESRNETDEFALVEYALRTREEEQHREDFGREVLALVREVVEHLDDLR